MKKVFIGYTEKHGLIYEVAKHSILRHSSDVVCYPIIQKSLRELGIYTRSEDLKGSTEFSITRFLTPWLAGYKGWVLFCDNDVLALDDLNELFEHADDKYAVMCVKHDYNPEGNLKLDGQEQSVYPRKNWSSVVLWNCDHPKNRQITPELVNNVSPLFLHRFMWLEDNEIGRLPISWNWLVGWNSESRNGSPKLLHFTEGGPYFKNYQNVDYASLWKDEFQLCFDKPFSALNILD
jgi:lipopolysaccharide biosynthesis glycosyltransferase